MARRRTARRARGAVPQVPNTSWWSAAWQPFWAVPVAFSVGAVVLGVLLPLGEGALRTTVQPYVFQGGPAGARGLLSAIATGMISMTALVFSITIVVLQLASSQFTPRVLGGFLDSRITQVTLGVFTASFVFALTVTRSVRGDGSGPGTFVPQLSVTVAFVLVLASVGCFLAFIHHITTSIQVSRVISRIGDVTLDLADSLYPDAVDDGSIGAGPTWSPAAGTPRVGVCTGNRHGVITSFDYDALVGFARDHEAVVTIDRPVGEFLTEGQEVLRVWGVQELDDRSRARLSAAISLGTERVMQQDVAFGIRQLVDIAERALSAGVNDPTTAVQCIDELHRILRRVVQRESPSPYIADNDGQVRVVHHPQSVEGLIHLAIAEIGHYGGGSVQVPPRLRGMLDDLEKVSAQRYREAIQRARDAVDAHLAAS